MVRFGNWIVRHRVLILIIGVLLLIPSVIGILTTRVNYDMLTYLPDDMETVIGQDILLDDFGKGAFSMVIVEGMDAKDVSALKEKIEEVDHVESVIWYDSIADLSIPMEFLPEKYYDAFNSGDDTLMAVFFDTSTSADETMDAVREIRTLAGEKCFVSGMSAMVTDLKDLCEREEPVYVGIAVLLATVAMMIFMDSWIIPFVFLLSIGMAIVVNLGSNFLFGEISYITKALAAVLQLAVTMDYSIFLWHSYNEELEKGKDKEIAMGRAIANTLTSVVGSSITTIAGFIALCFMTYTLGLDLGLVMAKGVLFGVIGCVTTLPSLILILDKLITKSRHRSILPKFEKTAKKIIKLAPVFLIAFLVILVPAIYGYSNTEVYYDLGETLPDDMAYVVANTKLQETFDMSSTHMLLVDANMPAKDAEAMMKEIDNVNGVKTTLGFNSLVGTAIPEELIPDNLRDLLKSDKYQLMLINSEYKVATDNVNQQIDAINTIVHKYDANGMLIGEAPCTKDMIEITDHDFKIVDMISIIAIFVIIALVLRSVSLPVILVAVIEFAIFINLGIPYFTNVSLPFIAPICISTIQLGATVDYAILMTSRYKRERSLGNDKKTSVTTALSTSMQSIIVSALGFFSATFGVALYSDVDIISSMCMLMARGAIISMVSVILVLPAMLMLFDKLIIHTSLGFRKKQSEADA